MSQIWEARTVVAKSPQTLPDVGIQRMGPQQGLILDASLSRVTRACRAASASLPHSRGVRTMRFTRAHMYPIHRITYLVHLVKVPPATESSVPAMKCAVPRAQNRVKTTVDIITFSRGRRGLFSSEERLFYFYFFWVGGKGEGVSCLF